MENQNTLRYRLEELNLMAGELEQIDTRRGLFSSELVKLSDIYRQMSELETRLTLINH